MKRPRQIQRTRTARIVMGMVTQQERDNYGDPFLLSQDEVAHRLGVSRTTLWRLVKQRELQAVHIGSRTFITTESINDFVNRHSA